MVINGHKIHPTLHSQSELRTAQSGRKAWQGFLYMEQGRQQLDVNNKKAQGCTSHLTNFDV